MQSIRQMTVRGALRAQPTTVTARGLRPIQAVRLAHASYGNEQSGMEQGTHLKNPKSNLEHPGPEAPANKGSISKEETTSSSSSSSSSSSNPSSSSSSSSQSSGSGEKSSDGARPAIHSPKSAAEDTDPEVKKHNEEMAQRNDRSVNQLSEEDNKVNKNFWSGDVGPKKD
ncbi:hypothetical protein LTR84_002779 [Exophiala bonariae]|uniref:Serine-rich protein n=1 Tax=Exophiala bonariae TaxID=1690606 RepID=A0AAV9NCP9_9EURO|nr:hypothetical protein LTR84_002779 [Exophiala bonariae]